MRLIITEKNNSAKKIAEILGRNEAAESASYKTPYYSLTDPGGEDQVVAVGLKGHVLSPAFPEGYSNWQETDPKSLIDAELVTEPTDKNVVKAVRKLAKEAEWIVIATDFDREGELIGLEALREALYANPELVDGGGELVLNALPPWLRASAGCDRCRSWRRPRHPLYASGGAASRRTKAAARRCRARAPRRS